jgi:putative membrane protein
VINLTTSTWEKTFFKFFIICYICGVVLLTFDLLPPWLEWANVVFLVTAGTLGAIYFIKNYRSIGAVFTLTVFTVSMAAEHFGVKYGFLFGDYYYNSYFGPKLFGVPITIGFAWVLVISTSHVMALRAIPHAPLLAKAILAAFATVVLDLIIDPVAFLAKEYWIWEGSSIYYDIPLFNFYSWFGLSLIPSTRFSHPIARMVIATKHVLNNNFISAEFIS